MRIRHRFALAFLILLSRLASAQEPATIQQQEVQTALEVRVVKPLIWRNYCLEVSIIRRNRSKVPIFLPFSGIFIYSTVMDTTNVLGQGNGTAWFVVYGLSDIICSDVTRLGPGETKQDTLCIEDTFPVVNSETKMRRQVRVQGRLRISAGYFPAAQKWQISNAQREEMMRTPNAKWKNADRLKGASVSFEISIPCPKGIGRAECTIPPPIFQGERHVPVPDISH